MNERLVFILRLYLMSVLWYIIGCLSRWGYREAISSVVSNRELYDSGGVHITILPKPTHTPAAWI